MFNYNNSLYVMVLLITLNFKVQIFSETNINNDIFTDFFCFSDIQCFHI